MPTPAIQRRWKNLPGEPVGDAGDPYTGYDRFGRTEQMRWIKPHTGDSGFDTLVNVQWGYNRASQKTWRKDLLAPASTGQDQHFGYDGLYQVTERQRGLLNVNTTAVGGVPAQVENFSYDETGNWITYRQVNDGVLGIDETRVNNRSNQMTQVDGSAAGVSYDKNGNMLTVPTGDGLTGSSCKLEWDAWNRLMKVSDADDNVIAEYQYDGQTRRTLTETGGVTRHCYYDDQWRTVEERLDSSTTPVTQHVWHPADRWELLFRDRSTANNGTLDERLYSLKDQLDPVAICDASGNVVERYDYTAFGISTILNADFTPKEPNTSTFDWNFLFHAEFMDTETGWFNYGYRYYVPTLGRWLSRDPIGIVGGLNLYGMVGNKILFSIDVHGLDPESTQYPGPFATESIPLTESRIWTKEQIEWRNNIFRKDGCHICGCKTGSAVLDHQPPIKNNPNQSEYRGYPSCTSCSFPKQANETKATKSYEQSNVPLSSSGNRPVTAAMAAAAAAMAALLGDIFASAGLQKQYSKAQKDCESGAAKRTSRTGCGCCYISILTSESMGSLVCSKDGYGKFYDFPCSKIERTGSIVPKGWSHQEYYNSI